VHPIFIFSNISAYLLSIIFFRIFVCVNFLMFDFIQTG